MSAGDVIWNPSSGEKAMIVESAAESGGARIVAELAVEAGGFVPGGEHLHDHLAEHVEVRAGRVAFVFDGPVSAAARRRSEAPASAARRARAATRPGAHS